MPKLSVHISCNNYFLFDAKEGRKGLPYLVLENHYSATCAFILNQSSQLSAHFISFTYYLFPPPPPTSLTSWLWNADWKQYTKLIVSITIWWFPTLAQFYSLDNFLTNWPTETILNFCHFYQLYLCRYTPLISALLTAVAT